MSESLSLLSEVCGGGGGGGGESGGVIDVVKPTEFWSTDLELPSVVESSLTCNLLMSTSAVDSPMQLGVRRSACSSSSKAVFGGGGAPSRVSKSKWILRREGAARNITQFPSSDQRIIRC